MLTPVRSIHVMAAVITDARGRILLARRTEGRDLAGRWEFPGGKREPGETPEAALARELQEELGIDIEVGEHVISVPQQYPDKRLRLDVRRLTRWKGTPRGHEGQALAWVAPDKLTRYAMPPADRPVVAALLHSDHYLVTPEPGDDDAAWLAALRRALAVGVQRVQVRARSISGERWQALASAAVQACRDAKAEVLINGDIDLARQLNTGVQLRASQLRDVTARPLPEDVPVAASCHTADDLQIAESLGCDFAVLGSLNPTATHPRTSPLGWEGFARLRENVSLPIYAIGGLRPQDIAEARQHGAQGIAAIRALWPA
ncbi:Nudix family hydrolase [Pseudoxanthomonas sp. UTMC 1351]|uniref:Nudix family hydrolase n=1 Tax=Pseudoxanthomonas sp. UTMC 1351 TaxID=2695853 RepID=UPI0034CE6F0F